MSRKIPGRSLRDVETAIETIIPSLSRNTRAGITRRGNVNPAQDSESFDTANDKKNKELK